MSDLLPISVSTRAMDPVTATLGQAQLTYDFPAQQGADIRVRRVRAGAEAFLDYGIDYTVQGVGNLAGGTVTLTPAALAADVYTVDGLAVLDRAASVVVNGKFASAQIDKDFNRALFRDQELRRDLTLATTGLGRALRVPAGETVAELSPAALRANSYLGGDGAGAIRFFPLPLIEGSNVLDFTTFPSRVLLAAADPVLGLVALDEARRYGLFAFHAGNFAAQVAADPLQGVYVAPVADATGASGCWVRQGADEQLAVTWFGALMDFNTGTLTGSDDGPAFHAALKLVEFRVSGRIVWPPGNGYVNTRAESITASTQIDVEVVGAGERVTTIHVGTGTRGFLACVNLGNYRVSASVSGLSLFLLGQADPTGSLAAAVSLTSGSAEITVSHPAHGRLAGDVVRIKLDRALAITGATAANPCVLTVVGHGLFTGDAGKVTGVVGMVKLNATLATVTVVDADHVSLDGIDASAYLAYVSGGTFTADSVGGVRVNGEYRVATVPGVNSYTITTRASGEALTDLASAAIAGGAGTLRYTYPRRGMLANPFQTVSGSRDVTVKLAAHGALPGDILRFLTTTVVNGITVQWTYTVISVIDADTLTIRDDRTSAGASATSAGWEGGSAEYMLFTRIPISISNRPGGSAGPVPRAVIENVSIDSALGGQNFAHIMINLLGTPRPRLSNVFLQGRNGDGSFDLAGQKLDCWCGINVTDCYTPVLDGVRTQQLRYGALSAANNSGAEGFVWKLSSFAEIDVGVRRECRSREPGITIDGGHVNYRSQGFEFVNAKNGSVRGVLFYCTAEPQEVPEVTRFADVAQLAGTNDVTVEGCRSSFDYGISNRFLVYTDTATITDATFIVRNNRLDVPSLALFKAESVNHIVLSGNDLMGGASQTVSIAGVAYHHEIEMYKNAGSGDYVLTRSMVPATANKTVRDNEDIFANNKAGSAQRVTMFDPATAAGRTYHIVNWQAQQVLCVDALNVLQNWIVPLDGSAATSVILPAAAGSWCTLLAQGGLLYKIAGSA